MKKLILLVVMGYMGQFGLAQAEGEAPVQYTAEQRHAIETFQKYDANGNGVISKKEYLVDAEASFAAKDTDNNGVLSFEEANITRINKTEKVKDIMEEKKKAWKHKLGKKLLGEE